MKATVRSGFGPCAKASASASTPATPLALSTAPLQMSSPVLSAGQRPRWSQWAVKNTVWSGYFAPGTIPMTFFDAEWVIVFTSVAEAASGSCTAWKPLVCAAFVSAARSLPAAASIFSAAARVIHPSTPTRPKP